MKYLARVRTVNLTDLVHMMNKYHEYYDTKNLTAFTPWLLNSTTA